MADFTDQDKELLDKLRKANERDAKTRSQLEPWQELLSRDETVNANRASAAAKIIEGFAGSWAAQYNYGLGSTLVPGGVASEAVAGVDPQGPPISVRSKISKVGQRGVPEINFVPYNWRTNTFGSKGPSLVGHPIGFEVVGPTLKSPVMDWTWRVLLGAGIGGGDVLQMDIRADGLPNVVEPYSGAVTDAYGPYVLNGSSSWVIGSPDEPNGGLYLVISDDGENPGSLPPTRLPMSALDLRADTASFEVFRIAQIPQLAVGLPYEIHLHPDKRLASYFDVSGAPNLSVRAITILKPYVTRLQAVPQSGAPGGNDGASTSGREQAFVVLSPERAATNDNYPPFDGGTLGDGTWLQGGFTESRAPGSTTTGAAAAYGGKSRLPIPNPVREITANVDSAFAVSALVGQSAIEVPGLTPYTTGLFASRFPVVRLSVTQRDDDLPALTFGTIPNCLGWFDVADTVVGPGPDHVLLNRVPETDPQTGLTYWGPGPFINDLIPREVGLLGTLHEPVEALWYGSFSLDKVESSRLKNLIDPQWVGRSEKQISDPLLVGGEPTPPAGAGSSRADRAIFDTRSFVGAGPIPNAEDPGNLMSLGFRMVLFPAKPDPNDPTQTIPDFDRPITGREMIIDGSINEKQYIDVDYSAGVVRLSHPPPTSRLTVPDEPTDIIPNGISGRTGNNPRGEVVLFASCVPFSMEDSQLGNGIRVTSSDDQNLRDFDTYSTEVSAKIDLIETTFIPTSPYIGVSGLTADTAIILDRLWDGPETGILSIQNGSDQGPSLGIWGYTNKVTVDKVPGTPVTALKGITAKSVSTNPDPSLFAGESTRWCVLRREVVFRRESLSIPFLSDFVPSDTYYGSSTRADTLRFQKSRIEPELDGSLTVRPLPDFGFQDRVTGRISPSKLPYPIGDVTLATPFYNYFAEEGLLMNLDYQVPAGDPRAPKPGGWFQAASGGPSIPMSTDGGAGISWHGWITVPGGVVPGNGQFLLRDNFRFVAKFSTSYRSGTQQAKAFIGLVQDSTFPLLTPTVDLITQGPTGGAEPGLPPRYEVVGLHLDNEVNPNWRFWTRGSSAIENLVPTDAISDASASTIGPVYYFVIEVQPYGAVVLPGSDIVKLGIFDENKRLLNTINVTRSDLLPNPLGFGLFVCGGVRRTATSDPGILDFHTYGVNVVLDKDTGTFDLPRLP